MKDVIVVGGGPSGLMAAASAKMHGADVLLLDKGNKLGRKLAISGGGRCNVTNRAPLEELIRHIPGNGRFMHSPFSVFNNEDIIRFFENLGIDLKEEDNGRMFPVSNKAADVVRAMLNHLQAIGVELQKNTHVNDLLVDRSSQAVSGVKLQDGTEIKARAVIIAAGGKSVPETGSTGDGYPWAEKAGHTITDLFPTEVPITLNDAFIADKTLQGLSLRDVSLSVIDPKKGKALKTHRGDFIFTHFGISGPIALRCSQYVVKAKAKHAVDQIALTADLFPDDQEESLIAKTAEQLKEGEKKAVKNTLSGVLPERLLQLTLERTGIEPGTASLHLSRADVQKWSQLVKRFPLTATGTLSIEKAFVTGGGVSLKEIEPKRMASKFTSGLYFSGEVLDLHGYTGGYNITVAFSTGYTAGKAAAEHIHVLSQ
ncbi:NAD(P)/FAD-dependent oxidoreductase [Salisediminibacterium halotolerans]|uniref:Aminoacetone oxidase family FAD-binding enzyme n=1 Tax=Salisediminibacterium halotolerans TaxID=517425 RepID=A0A1H9UY38_9BACI|nr:MULTISPECIES: NAD(P)/FAD-dependent oxidoreductase [Salisediminibacterium]RLJ69425.1 hypothetical protein BCL39_2698 [Actinophytocola xinjiangensis]RPE83949.1 hypothetical protein EDD67_2510 [Salisediminibacterium halotolerans]TWG32500.1 hypothetical protein BCL52_2693 [Salisediminibacterium halotolerans]SES14014.1 hypothetical protein SAMN05444126_11650 [Salisediminibacterium haloalkalitolerans]GEL07659.1 hypothetical protein SHA02_10750 [Salisediminibacterium halotolerans]